MDTLSTSVSAIKLPSRRSSIDLHNFKSPSISHLPPHPHRSSTTHTNKQRPSISTRPTSITRKTPIALFSSTTAETPNHNSTTHNKPSTGYAAALLDIAQCNNTLQAVEKDVQRFSKLMRNNRVRALFTSPFVGETQKGQMVKELAEKGNFHKQLVGLLKVLIGKNKSGMLEEVLEEFERIYDELIGTQTVLVSSAIKMEEEELFGIAKRVQRMSGAMKVKVRNLVDERLPSFAEG